jgi:hypothetical protein
MLFRSRPGGEFRRHPLGGAHFLGDTDYGDWPLEPIEIVDGIPFLVVRGYDMAGESVPPVHYVDYCIEHCDWSPLQYLPGGKWEKERALAKLLASPKWRRPLEQYEIEFLSDQVREPKRR